MLAALAIAASLASLIVNGPKAWPVVKDTGCVVVTGHKCKKPLTQNQSVVHTEKGQEK
mgnify:CR=1 FL=1